MKKSILKLAVFLAVFVLAFFIVGKIMNKDHDNLTMDLAPASLPVVSMMLDGREYNHLHGYTQAVDVAFERDTVTILGGSRDTDFVIDTYGREIQECGRQPTNRKYRAFRAEPDGEYNTGNRGIKGFD